MKSVIMMEDPEICNFSSNARNSGNEVMGLGKQIYEEQESSRVRLSRARGARGRNSRKQPTWIGESSRVRRFLRSEILSNNDIGMAMPWVIWRCWISWDHSEKSQMRFLSMTEAVVTGMVGDLVLRS